MDALFGKIWLQIKKKEYLIPFCATFVVGFLAHMYLFVNKFPNADAMTNFYFDQNMITSGRWFLSIACGISSYYDLNWVIGILSILYLALASVFISEFFEINSCVGRASIGALLVTFPAVTATFAYLYTADGYMLAFLLAVLAAYFTKKYKWGFCVGMLCLACSIGTYQAYLSVTILLCLFSIMCMCLKGLPFKEMISKIWRYLIMGIGGGILYYIILKVCLILQKKTLDSYQGIDQIGKISAERIPSIIYDIYYDFIAFVTKGNIFINNGFSAVCVILLALVACVIIGLCFWKHKLYKKWHYIAFLIFLLLALPLGTNVIFAFSSSITFHLLMRMQWVFFPIYVIVLIDLLEQKSSTDKKEIKLIFQTIVSFLGVISLAGLVYHFVLVDNIAYFNMNERYEKTYAYCVRLVDRIEETPGYEVGMPIAMIGVVDEEKYPKSDITGAVTSRITGTNGDILIYKGEQYAQFMKHYLNVTINLVGDEQIVEIYHSPEYREMDSFPAENSIKIVDGIMYIKTEPKG